MKQTPTQSFKNFVKEVQLKARSINFPDDEIKGKCINGARPNLKMHLSMAKPTNMEALLKLPCIVSEVSEEPIHQMFQVLNDKLDDLQSSRTINNEKLVTFSRSSSRSHGRSPGRRPSETQQQPRRPTSSRQAPPQQGSRYQG